MSPHRIGSALLGLFLLTGTVMAQTSTNESISALPDPPQAKKVPKVTAVHGDSLFDDYFWLREKTNPEVISYLEAENAYAAAVMKPTEALQKKLYDEMLGRIQQTDLSVPYKFGDYFYYSRTEEGKQYSIQCRKKGSLDSPEEVVLDLNELARGHKFLGLNAYEVSDDGNRLAFSIDTTGFRQYLLQVKDLTTGKTWPESIPKTGSVAWAADNATIFYTVEDAAKRQYRVYRHTVGSAAANDVLVYEEKDEKFDVDVSRSRSKAVLFLTSGSHTTSEERWLPADHPAGAWKLIAAREAGHEYYADQHGDRFYIRTNKGAKNFRLVSAPMSDPKPANWKEEIPHRDDVMIEGLDCFADHYVTREREKALAHFEIRSYGGGAQKSIGFPEPVYTAFPSANPEYQTQAYRYTYNSFITPQSVFDYDLATGQSKLLKRTAVLGGYDPSRYESERLWANARDGTKIPISIVYRRDLKRDGTAPMLLYGYGSYGLPQSAGFSSNRVSLLDRGVVYAIAHIRGGGEMGRAWHDHGKMMEKKNTFTDFIDAAQFLIDDKWTSTNRLVIQGGSAGGLLMGAVTNMRPDLFKAVVAQVPFVDVMNTMLDASLPLTVTEFEEWGNPRDKAAWDYMRSYSPYDNIGRKPYPAILVKTSLNDSQVMYWEPAKFVAKLRANKTDTNPLVFKINMGAGHGGSSGRYDALHDTAFDYAFILSELGLNNVP
ncbi:MAG TPA: S9 family peptidase [Candidatus Udaeobacter sp.]|jgi:oligopeptidase B|nr:S9 family peptidase [Candidatus Udaeobacter sp.]